jgi:catechol 2,3-dioxygenase-like lactoylglutathione lyase family enzyme
MKRNSRMRVKRITANIRTSDIDKADAFYHDVLGLKAIMDHGWIRTYGLDSYFCIEIEYCISPI